MKFPSITYRVQTLITAPEIDTDILWGLSFFFMGLAVVYFVSAFLFRNRISSKSARTKQRKTELSPMISEFLFYEEDADKSEKSKYIELKIAIRELLRDDFNRKVLAEVLLDLRKDVSGDTQRRLFKLYQDLGLDRDAFLKLKSWRWEVISKGIMELTLMQVEDAHGFIVKFINDRRATIRKQAEIATVTLKPEGIDYFLDTTKYRLSEWQQLKLLDVLRNKEDFEPPRFKAWLTSTNKHVVLFSLRLIKYYRQNDANASLVELIKHKDHQVRQQAIDCIKEFNVTEALPTLKGVFWKCTVDIKIAILGAIAELGTERDIEFLESVSQREGNFSVKSKAVGAINTIVPESVMPTEGIEYVKEYENPNTLPIEKDLSMASTPISDEALRNIEIEFDEVRPIASLEIHNGIEPADLKTEELNPIGEKPTERKPKEGKPIARESMGDDFVCKESPENQEDVDSSILHFLPLVVDNESEGISERSNASHATDVSDTTDAPEVAQDEVKDMEVHSVESVSELMDAELEDLVAEIREITFLPFVTDEETEPQPERDINRKESPEHIDGYSLSDFEVSFSPKNPESPTNEEEVEREEQTSQKGEPRVEKEMEQEGSPSEKKAVCEQGTSHQNEAVHFNLEEESIIDLEHPQVKDVLSWILADNEMRNIECRYETVPHSSDEQAIHEFIPEPVYYDEHEAYMMGLLDDLEELGDHREIPLLEELKTEESKNFIKDRIDLMIQKFEQQQTVRNTKTIKSSDPERNSVVLPVFSVFADLFKSIDLEAKLILLDEVVAVGDEKDIEFLDGLLEEPNQEIRKKAHKVLKELIVKLSHEKPSATYSKGVSDIVAEQMKSDEDLSEQIYDSLLTELGLKGPEGGKNASESNQDPADSGDATPASHNDSSKSEEATSVNDPLFDIDFEICEVLDKKCASDILNLSVIYTEIAPNSGGGSFLKQIRNITKLFF